MTHIDKRATFDIIKSVSTFNVTNEETMNRFTGVTETNDGDCQFGEGELSQLADFLENNDAELRIDPGLDDRPHDPWHESFRVVHPVTAH